MKRWTYKTLKLSKYMEGEHIHSVWCLDVEDNISW